MVQINLIGGDGTGKNAVYDQILQTFEPLAPNGIHKHYEPGGSKEADIIRYVLLDANLSLSSRIHTLRNLLQDVTEKTKKMIESAVKEMETNGLTGLAEAYLYAASRLQTNEKVIRPMLNRKKWIFGIRSVACSMSYQGRARNLGMPFVWELNKPALDFASPTLEILLDVPVSIALERIQKREEEDDRLDKESKEFFERVREGYLEYYQTYCPYPYKIVDASKPLAEVVEETKSIIQKHLAEQNAL